MDQLWKIYYQEMPEFIKVLIQTPSLQRLKDIGMNCGVEYTNFSFFQNSIPYSRYEHSIGVSLIVYHFTHDKKQTVAGLLHDIATPVFAHTIDFYHQDHLKQESTEFDTKKIIEQDQLLVSLLKEYDLTIEEVCNYHLYPLCDNDSPQLSADRLEYTLGNMYSYGFCTLKEIQNIFNDLKVNDLQNEIIFKHEEIAHFFTKKMLQYSHVYVMDEDRYAMEYLSYLIKKGIKKNVVSERDFYLKEKEFIDMLKKDQEINKLWKNYQKLNKVEHGKNTDYFCVKVFVKKRYIDVYVESKGRISTINQHINKEIQQFLQLDFNYFMYGKSE